jgi:hypothetical protein
MSALLLAGGTGAALGADVFPVCPADRTFRRSLDVWYGTVTIKDANGVVLSTKNAVAIDQTVSSFEDPDVPGMIQVLRADPAVDQRVKDGLGAFDDGTGDSAIVWALRPPTGSDANPQQTLLNAFGTAGATAGAGTLTQADPTSAQRTLQLGAFDSGEFAPVLVGDFDALDTTDASGALLCGHQTDNTTILCPYAPFGVCEFPPGPCFFETPPCAWLVTVHSVFVADVTFHELNATYTLVPAGFACRTLDAFGQTSPQLSSTSWAGARSTTEYRVGGGGVEVKKGGPLYWKPQSFGRAQRACVKLTRLCSSGHHSVLLKTQGTWPSGTIAVFYDSAAKRVGIETYRPDKGWRTLRTFARVLAHGDVLGGEALEDGTLRAYVNGELVGEASGGTWFGGRGGRIGLWFFGSCRAPATLDDFGGE